MEPPIATKKKVSGKVFGEPNFYSLLVQRLILNVCGAERGERLIEGSVNQKGN